MPASFEMRGTAVTHDPNLRLDGSLGKLPAFDPIKLLEGFIDMFIEVMEDIPILGDLVKVLKELLDTNGNGHLELEDLLGLLTGRGILDGLAALFGGNNGLPFEDIFAGLADLFGGLLPGGGLNADNLMGLIPSWLLPLMPINLLTGPQGNLVADGGFDRLPTGASGTWYRDPAVGRTAGGAAAVVADGTLHELFGVPIACASGDSLDLSVWHRSAGTASSGSPVQLRVDGFNGTSLVGSTVIASAAPAGSSWAELSGSWTAPVGVDRCCYVLVVNTGATAGTVWFDDVSVLNPGGLLELDWVAGLPGMLSDLGNWIEHLVDQLLGSLNIPIIGDLLDKILDLADGVADWQSDTNATSDDLVALVTGLLTNPGGVLGSIPQANIPIVSDVIKGITGFLSGQGSSSSSNVLADMLGALNMFTGSTNTTATTADSAQGVGSNALTNTVSIQAQVSGLVDRADAGWTARPLYASMDYTADATFAKMDMAAAMSTGAHSHSFSGSTDNPGNHNHSYQSGDSTTLFSGNAGGHTHSVSGSTSSSGSSITPAVVNSSTAFLGYIRCGSVQEKRLFTFLAQSSGTVSTFNLDVYRMTSDGGLTLAYSSANFAGAITGVLGWVQHAIPSGTASVAVQPGDIIAIQLRMTGSGSVSLGGITTPLPLNPAGWYPLRESAVRNPTTPAPSTIAAGTANASHTSTAIPYIEAGIDTGLANAPLALADNFNGSLSQYWLMTGFNSLEIASNNLGIYQTGTSGSTGVSWGKFQKQVNTDQSKVGFTTTSPNGQRQIVWFHGSGPNDHVGLEITSSYATLYTMAGGSRTQRAQVAISTAAATYEIRYAAGTKVYSVWRNGSQITSWTDSGNTAPTGLGNRYGGVALEGTRTGWFGLSFDKANPIDDWLLADI